MSMDQTPFYWVREDILPEALLKTLQAKLLLHQGSAKTVHDAVDRVGLSRSAFYKYKDGILLPHEWRREWMVTISMRVVDQAGMLSRLIALVADLGGNILTINQTIPLQGVANVVITIDMSNQQAAISELTSRLQQIEGISEVQVIGQG